MVQFLKYFTGFSNFDLRYMTFKYKHIQIYIKRRTLIYDIKVSDLSAHREETRHHQERRSFDIRKHGLGSRLHSQKCRYVGSRIRIKQGRCLYRKQG